MAYTTRQMLDMATGFWHKQYGIEIKQRVPGKKGEWLVMVSENEALAPNLEVVLVENDRLPPSLVVYPTIDKAFAVMEAFLLRKKETT